jgi:hypothetical protein
MRYPAAWTLPVSIKPAVRPVEPLEPFRIVPRSFRRGVEPPGFEPYRFFCAFRHTVSSRFDNPVLER